MTATIRPVRFSTHGDKRWKPAEGYAFACEATVVAIAIEELSVAAQYFPLAFLAGARPSLVAVLGLQPQQNLFIGPDGQWLSAYVPAVLRSYPFKLLPAENGTFAMGYDDASGLLGEVGEAFFEAMGQPTERVAQLLQFLIHVNRGLDRAAAAAAMLGAHDVLEPWPLKARDEGGDSTDDGLLRLSEDKLNRLSDNDFLVIRRAGALPLAYAQQLSMPNLSLLGRLARTHRQHAVDQARQRSDAQSLFDADPAGDDIDWDRILNSDDNR